MLLRSMHLTVKVAKQKLLDCKSSCKVTIKAASKNKDAVYIGGSDVSVDNGFPIYPGETFPVPCVDYDTLYFLGSDKDILYLLVWS
jgi:hypothetical protein